MRVFAGENWFDTFGRPVFEPVGELLDRGEVGIEVAGVHRAQVAGGMVVDDAGGVEPPDDRFGARASCVLFRAHDSRGSCRPSISSGFMSSS